MIKARAMMMMRIMRLGSEGPAFAVFAVEEDAGGFGVENLAAQGVVFDGAFDEGR
jgi:hypothetical protein